MVEKEILELSQKRGNEKKKKKGKREERLSFK